jgi:hypothetical protein
MKKRIIILASVVAAVVLLWSAAWLVLAGIVKDNIAALAQADGVTQVSLACQDLDVTGFPFRFDVDCEAARIVSEDVVVEVAGIRASIRVYAPNHVLASALGPLKLTDNFTGTRNDVTWATLDASLRLSDWRIARGSVSAKDVVWSDALFSAEIAQSPLVELHLFDMADAFDADRKLSSLAAYMRADAIDYPALTLVDTNVEAQLELSGLPGDVRGWGAPSMLAEMQRAGGELKIIAISGNDATSTLSADGRLALSDTGMLDGQIAIKSTGVAERIGHLLEEPIRTLVLGAPAADGSYTNQINFRNGTVFSGLVPLVSLAPLF